MLLPTYLDFQINFKLQIRFGIISTVVSVGGFLAMMGPIQINGRVLWVQDIPIYFVAGYSEAIYFVSVPTVPTVPTRSDRSDRSEHSDPF